jgi:hypothetical protein
VNELRNFVSTVEAALDESRKTWRNILKLTSVLTLEESKTEEGKFALEQISTYKSIMEDYFSESFFDMHDIPSLRSRYPSGLIQETITYFDNPKLVSTIKSKDGEVKIYSRNLDPDLEWYEYEFVCSTSNFYLIEVNGGRFEFSLLKEGKVKIYESFGVVSEEHIKLVEKELAKLNESSQDSYDLGKESYFRSCSVKISTDSQASGAGGRFTAGGRVANWLKENLPSEEFFFEYLDKIE